MSRSSLPMLFVSTLLGAACVCSTPTSAAPWHAEAAPAAEPATTADFKPQRIAADAQWVAFLDVQGLLKSSLVKFCMENGGDVGIDIDADDLAAIKEQLGGLDPMHDIGNITLYGEGDPEKGGHLVALVETTAKIDDAIAQLTGAAKGDDKGDKNDADDVTTVDIDGHHVHVFSDGEQKAYFMVRPGPTSADRLVVVSMSREWMARGLGALEGKVPTLDRADKPAFKAKPPSGTLVFAAAANLDWIDLGEDNDEAASAILKGARGLSFDYGESGNDTFLHMRLETAKAEDAENLSDIMRGLVAMGRLAAGEEKELKPLLEPLKALKMQCEGPAISLSFNYSTQKLLDLARTAMAEDKAGEHHGEVKEHGDKKDSKKEVSVSVSVGKKDADKTKDKKDNDDDER